MKKLTAGIFAGILSVVAVNAAHAGIATTTYVQGGVTSAKNLTKSMVGELGALTTSAKDNTVAAINEVNAAVATVNNNMVKTAAEVDATSKASTTLYPSMAAAVQIANDAAQAKLNIANDNLNTLTGQVEALETNLENLNDLHEGDIKALRDLVGETSVSDQIDAKVNALDVASVGGSGNIIKSISQTDGKITAVAGKVAEADLDNTLATKINGKLDTSTTTVTNGNYIQAANSVAQNLTALDGQAKANADEIAKLTGTGEGSITKQIETLQTTVKETTDGLNGRLTTVEGKVTTLTGDADTEGSVANALKQAKAYTDQKDTAMDARVDVLEAATDGYSATNKISTAVADAKKAGTDAAAALETYKTTQAATDKTQTDAIAALEAKVGDNDVTTALNGKMDLAPTAANKLLTTNAAGQVIAATATGSCTAEDGVSCMMVSDGAGGFRMESIVDKWSD